MIVAVLGDCATTGNAMKAKTAMLNRVRINEIGCLFFCEALVISSTGALLVSIVFQPIGSIWIVSLNLPVRQDDQTYRGLRITTRQRRWQSQGAGAGADGRGRGQGVCLATEAFWVSNHSTQHPTDLFVTRA